MTRGDDNMSYLWTGFQVLFQKKLAAPHVVSRGQIVNSVFGPEFGEWLEGCNIRARLIVDIFAGPANELNVEWYNVVGDLYTASIDVAAERVLVEGDPVPACLVLVDGLQQLVYQWVAGLGLSTLPPRIRLTRREVDWLQTADMPPRVHLPLTTSPIPVAGRQMDVDIWEYFPGGVEDPLEYFTSRFASAGRPDDVLQELHRMIGLWVDCLGCRTDSIEMQAVDLVCQGRMTWERALNAPEQFADFASNKIDDAEDILVMIYG